MGPCMCVAVGTTVVSIEGMSTSKGLLGLDSATTSMAGRNPTFSSLNTPHSRHHRLGFCLDIKLAIIATSPRLEHRRGLLYFAPIQDPTFSINLSFNPQYLDCNISSYLFSISGRN